MIESARPRMLPSMVKPYRDPLWLRILNGVVAAVITAQLALFALVAGLALAVVIGIVSLPTR